MELQRICTPMLKRIIIELLSKIEIALLQIEWNLIQIDTVQEQSNKTLKFVLN